MLPCIWVILSIFLLCSEIFWGKYYFLAGGTASLFTAVLSYKSISFVMQTVIFIILFAVLSFLTKKFADKFTGN
ncbi:MAG: hypothetical protein CSB55_02375 [Candidatus Cloacimonadota bacterium]|nr:MAG: hypothetical protein CSB55_02375 [Candidatus Cloacimonadota bacterium]